MRTTLARTLVPVLASGLALPLAAQVPAPVIPIAEGQGMWTADAVGVQWSATAQPSRLGVRDAGVAGATVGTWSATRFGGPSLHHPDYSPQALFAHWVPALHGQGSHQWSATNPDHNPRFGGWSTGGDITPAVDTAGVLQLDPTESIAWYNLSFTVDEQAVGVAGSAVAQARALTGRAADHVFSYTADGSSLIRADYVHTVRTEFTGAQLGLPGAQPQLTALDWGMGLISETPGGTPSRLQPVRNRLYFTLTGEWLAQQGPVALGGMPLKSNEVYGMEWEGTQWSVPVVAFSEQDLFGASQPAAELDALSVYSGSGVLGQEATAVFSLTPTSVLVADSVVQTPDQILVTQRGAFHPTAGNDVVAATLSVETETTIAPISTVMGLEKGSVGGSVPDNVTGLCGRDPSEGQSLDIYKGTPTDGAEAGFGVELAALRHFDVTKIDDATGVPTVVDTLRLTASGIDEKDYDLVIVEFYMVGMQEVNGVLEPKLGLPVLSTFGTANAGLIEGVYPFTLPPGSADELRIAALVHGVKADPLVIDPNIAVAASVTLGLE